MTHDRDRLRELAERADVGGREWAWSASISPDKGGYPQEVVRVGDAVLICELFEGPDAAARYGPYIAASDPPTVLALLDDLRDAEAERDRLAEWIRENRTAIRVGVEYSEGLTARETLAELDALLAPDPPAGT